ncbi:RIP metalloprotease RseP [Chitinophaga silvatica]|uniref:Zinc metalloprotease n=1 Tax=Chitinophaga silvatica TaxID=2282649 RepID=A0A3E1YEH7_9BACT|nr:RIP metalloprotease RseP [Chitinophaga silvatica]RFS24955.1 RIP metalloprotease RseP [Chitinophaga silvatica]
MSTEEILIKAAQLILSLSILVVLHELGHFIPAKLFKTRVEKFYLFFDPWFSILKFKKGETEYGIGWVPLGGYVKISGMIDESMDTEQMAKPPQPYEFRSKPTWQRLIIMIGGVVVNILVAFFIYAMLLWHYGETRLPNASVVYGVEADSLGRSIGIQDGDKIVSLDNRPVKYFDGITAEVILKEVKSIQVDRAGQVINLPIPEGFVNKLIKRKSSFVEARRPFVIDTLLPDGAAIKTNLQKGDTMFAVNGVPTPFMSGFTTELRKHKSESVDLGVLRGKDTLHVNATLSDKGTVGIGGKEVLELSTIHYTFLESLPAGFHKGIDKLKDYVSQLRLIFVSKEIKATESVGGFASIANLFPAKWDWVAFWNLTAFLSIVLAFMNILPIPGLDGGHVLFLVYEIVTGRKPSEKFLEYAQVAGMLLVLALLLFANGLDVWRWLKGLF